MGKGGAHDGVHLMDSNPNNGRKDLDSTGTDDQNSKQTSTSSQLEQIPDQETHDSIVNKKSQAANTPLIILITSSTPTSNTLRESVVELSQKQEFVEKGVKWYEMPLTAKTTPMIKFGPQNCPIVVLMRGMFCETLLGVRGGDEVEKKVEAMMKAS